LTSPLTDQEGQRLNGKEAEFFIARPEDGAENSCSQSRPDGQGRGVVPGGEVAQSLRHQCWTEGGAERKASFLVCDPM